MNEEYSRVNSCLHGWCKELRPECWRCDRVLEIIRQARSESALKTADRKETD